MKPKLPENIKVEKMGSSWVATCLIPGGILHKETGSTATKAMNRLKKNLRQSKIIK